MTSPTEDDIDRLSVQASVDERRRYNRRRSDAAPPPPYFSVFERMADALDAIVGLLAIAVEERRQVDTGTPPATTSVPETPTGETYPRPRTSSY